MLLLRWPIILLSFLHLQNNTFQGLVITDGTRSYTVFTYRCGLLQWSGLDGFYPHAVIGYNMRGQFINHPLSGFSQVLNVACSNTPATPWSNLVYAIGDRENDLQRARAECFRRYNDDRRVFGNIIPFRRQFTRSCPCTRFQAVRDFRFRFDFERSVFLGTRSIFCYTQRFPVTFVFGGGQLCCYEFR